METEEIVHFSVSMRLFGSLTERFAKFHKIFVQINEFDWLPERKNVLKNVKKIFYPETVKRKKLIICIEFYGIKLCIIFGRIKLWLLWQLIVPINL